MYLCADDLLVNLVALTPKLARRQFRKHIFEAWDWKCAYCERELTEDTATIDHVIPKHKGGHNVKNNMVCCCCKCNRSKGSQLLADFYTENNPNYCEKRLDKLNEWMEQKPCSIKLTSSDSAVPYISNDCYIGWVAT
jgi:hypothetical protein